MIRVFALLLALLSSTNGVWAQEVKGSTRPSPNTLNTGTGGLNPTGTASASAIMMGMGSSATIVPNLSGAVLITIQGQVSNNTANDGAGIQVRYGTGAAPANGAAPTGTVCATTLGPQGTVAAGLRFPFSSSCTVTGLTVGTTYWIDAGLFAITGGTASINNVTVIAAAL